MRKIIWVWVSTEYKTKRKLLLLCPTCKGQVFTCPDPACERDGENAHHAAKPTDCPDFSTKDIVTEPLTPEECVRHEEWRKAVSGFKTFYAEWSKTRGPRLLKNLVYRSSELKEGESDLLLHARIEEMMSDAWMAAKGFEE